MIDEAYSTGEECFSFLPYSSMCIPSKFTCSIKEDGWLPRESSLFVLQSRIWSDCVSPPEPLFPGFSSLCVQLSHLEGLLTHTRLDSHSQASVSWADITVRSLRASVYLCWSLQSCPFSTFSLFSRSNFQHYLPIPGPCLQANILDLREKFENIFFPVPDNYLATFWSDFLYTHSQPQSFSSGESFLLLTWNPPPTLNNYYLMRYED